MRTLLAALTALMLFATPVVAGDLEDGLAAYNVGDYYEAFRLWERSVHVADELAPSARSAHERDNRS